MTHYTNCNIVTIRGRNTKILPCRPKKAVAQTYFLSMQVQKCGVYELYSI